MEYLTTIYFCVTRHNNQFRNYGSGIFHEFLTNQIFFFSKIKQTRIVKIRHKFVYNAISQFRNWSGEQDIGWRFSEERKKSFFYFELVLHKWFSLIRLKSKQWGRRRSTCSRQVKASIAEQRTRICRVGVFRQGSHPSIKAEQNLKCLQKIWVYFTFVTLESLQTHLHFWFLPNKLCAHKMVNFFFRNNWYVSWFNQWIIEY